MLESLIRDRIVEYLETNKLINSTQHVFRNKRFCLTNLLDFFNEMIKTLDEEKAIDIVYLDFQKAFDKVPHARLLEKIRAHACME